MWTGKHQTMDMPYMPGESHGKAEQYRWLTEAPCHDSTEDRLPSHSLTFADLWAECHEQRRHLIATHTQWCNQGIYQRAKVVNVCVKQDLELFFLISSSCSSWFLCDFPILCATLRRKVHWDGFIPISQKSEMSAWESEVWISLWGYRVQMATIVDKQKLCLIPGGKWSVHSDIHGQSKYSVPVYFHCNNI